MSAWPGELSLGDLQTGLRRLGSVESLVTAERALLVFSLAELSARAAAAGDLDCLWTGWTGSSLPWPLRPLHWMFNSTRQLSVAKNPRVVIEFSQVLATSDRDSDFVDFWSVPQSLVEEVARRMRAGGVDPEDVLLAEPRSALLHIETRAEAVPEARWWVETRCGTECPRDLAAALEAFEDEPDE